MNINKDEGQGSATDIGQREAGRPFHSEDRFAREKGPEGQREELKAEGRGETAALGRWEKGREE
jgi:hypothetical protein